MLGRHAPAQLPARRTDTRSTNCCGWPSNEKVDRPSARLDWTLFLRQGAARRSGHPGSGGTSRRRGRADCHSSIHARDADDDIAAILEDEMGKGAFPFVLHCFFFRPDPGRNPAFPASRGGLLLSFSGHSDLQEVRGAEGNRPAIWPPRSGLLVETGRALSGADCPTGGQTQPNRSFVRAHRACAGRDHRLSGRC